MTDRSQNKTVGRGLLLGAALGAFTLAGCVTPEGGADEQVLYSHAIRTGDPALASEFLRRYPASPRSAAVLTSLPPAALSQVSPLAVAGLPPATLAQVPANVRRQLGVTTQIATATANRDLRAEY